MQILIACLFIFFAVLVLMGGIFLLSIRLGIFNIKDSPDSMTWEEFKIGWKEFSFRKMWKELWKMTFKW